MIDIVIQRRGDLYIPFGEEDRLAGLMFNEHHLLHARIGVSTKERSYKQLCCYMSSCSHIARLGVFEGMTTKESVDHLTRVRCGFVHSVVTDSKGQTHHIVKRLNYVNCDQPTAHRFIEQALRIHAGLAGYTDTSEYVASLRPLTIP